MKFVERSYSSQIFRPKPLISLDEDRGLLVVTTSWGQSDAARVVGEEISKFVGAASGDVEVTSPYETLTCLSDEANHLRVSFMIANELLYRGENRNEYQSGVEVFAMTRKGSRVVWAQVGGPHLFLRRKNQPLLPVSVSYDHSFEAGSQGSALPPLPSRMLGIESTCHVALGEVVVDRGDEMILLASSRMPPSLWMQDGVIDLAGITKKMIEQDADQPFWASHLTF